MAEMLIKVDLSEKSFGHKMLYTDLQFEIQEGEKVGLIGRNGTGKSTLFNILNGDDNDYQGEVNIKKGTVVIASRQEHHGHTHKTVIEYIQGDLPEFSRLHHILTTYPLDMAEHPRKMERYSEAVERFSHLGYYQIEDEIEQAFVAYQLDPKLIDSQLSELSGGQKRMVELIKVQRARGDIALIDEPTNHMDTIAKQTFLKWFNAAQEAIVVITHDRDVLQSVDRIIEIRDGRAFPFKGNYRDYLRINKNQITAQVNEYDLTQKRIENLKEDVIRFRRMKEKSRDPGTIKRFKAQENKAADELYRLQQTEKPSFWIDQNSVEDLNIKLSSAYSKYKARNIRVNTKTSDSNSGRLLLEVKDASLGYNDVPLFEGVHFQLHEGERLRLQGRNGAGKTTLVQAILAKINGTQPLSQQFKGHIIAERDVRCGVYEQEIAERYLPMTLYEALEQVFRDKDLPISDTRIRQLMSDYLFNPQTDADMLVDRLSGGQKARFQLINMLANAPQLLILDEPTNHLDLPSIEELENALKSYNGAVLYISHDSFFAEALHGATVPIGG
jgi:ATPase subunit of ABC transporter with duplicated ATPase domains